MYLRFKIGDPNNFVRTTLQIWSPTWCTYLHMLYVIFSRLEHNNTNYEHVTFLIETIVKTSFHRYCCHVKYEFSTISFSQQICTLLFEEKDKNIRTWNYSKYAYCVLHTAHTKWNRWKDCNEHDKMWKRINDSFRIDCRFHLYSSKSMHICAAVRKWSHLMVSIVSYGFSIVWLKCNSRKPKVSLISPFDFFEPGSVVQYLPW